MRANHLRAHDQDADEDAGQRPEVELVPVRLGAARVLEGARDKGGSSLGRIVLQIDQLGARFQMLTCRLIKTRESQPFNDDSIILIHALRAR